jgi:hypothetical protein
MRWYSRACPMCGGTLHDDPDDAGWRKCMLCGRSFAADDQATNPLRRLSHVWKLSNGTRVGLARGSDSLPKSPSPAGQAPAQGVSTVGDDD